MGTVRKSGRKYRPLLVSRVTFLLALLIIVFAANSARGNKGTSAREERKGAQSSRVPAPDAGGDETRS